MEERGRGEKDEVKEVRKEEERLGEWEEGRGGVEAAAKGDRRGENGEKGKKGSVLVILPMQGTTRTPALRHWALESGILKENKGEKGREGKWGRLKVASMTIKVCRECHANQLKL